MTTSTSIPFVTPDRHTPGPWRVVRPTNFTASIADDNSELAYAHKMADARLIAVAPDLLEALRVLVAEFETSCEFQPQCDAVDAARAAIAKAEGRV